MIRYRLDVADPHAHRFHVRLEVPRPGGEVTVSLPVWIPGSYMVREFSRHLSGLAASQGGVARDVEQLDKATWRVRCHGGAPLAIEYDAYAFDTSVRTAWLDARRGFFNGTSVFLRAHGREDEPHRVTFGALPRGWQVATAMNPAGRLAFEAADYHECVDHPFELGTFERFAFELRGVPHEIVVAGALPSADLERLKADVRRIVETQIAFWHGPRRKPPYERYVFMLNCVDDGYGGLEHRASTALIAGRRDLPRFGQKETSDGYVTLLGLFSHEFFHTWNVKRLKPREFEALDYSRENYTRLLWFFEGFTSYYDDLLLRRAGLIDSARYLRLVARNAAAVLATPGRFVQSVADASFDAWIKYYRPDENTPNATVSYYAKGALVALALDLTLRSEGRGTLDDVMRRLWASSAGGPLSEGDIAAALAEAGGRDCSRELAEWVHGTAELPLRDRLERFGVAWSHEPASLAQRLGVKVSEGALSGVQVKQVLRASPAERAGLAAGDELLAADGWRLRRLDDALMVQRSADAPIELLVSRDQRVFTVRVDVPPADAGAGPVALAPAASPGAAALALRRAWLGD